MKVANISAIIMQSESITTKIISLMIVMLKWNTIFIIEKKK